MRGRQFDPRDAQVIVRGRSPADYSCIQRGRGTRPPIQNRGGWASGITSILVSIHLLMLLVRFLRGDDTGLRDRPDRDARLRTVEGHESQTLQPERTRHHTRHPTTRGHSRRYDSHSLHLVNRSLRKHNPRPAYRPRNIDHREPGLRREQHEADPIPQKHWFNPNHSGQLLRSRPERERVRKNHLASTLHTTSKHCQRDRSLPSHQRGMLQLHEYWKLLYVPIREQLHNNPHHSEKQPVLLHNSTIGIGQIL